MNVRVDEASCVNFLQRPMKGMIGYSKMNVLEH